MLVTALSIYISARRKVLILDLAGLPLGASPKDPVATTTTTTTTTAAAT